MQNAPEQYDFFVSYARADNQPLAPAEPGWITRFLDALQEEQLRFTGDRRFSFFFDKTDIRSLDDWRSRIKECLAASRLLVAFISPAYFASEWCRREWRTWIDVEIAKHVLSDGAAPIYIVEVPWLANAMTEHQIAEEIARLSNRSVESLPPGMVRDAASVSTEVSSRQFTQGTDAHGRGTAFFPSVEYLRDAGIAALRRQDLRTVLANLARDLTARSGHVEAALRSRSTIPPYNRRFVGRLEELTKLRELLHQGRTGVISGHKGIPSDGRGSLASVHGLGGIGKTELAFTYAHAFAGLYPGGRFYVPCDGCSDVRRAVLQLDEVFGEKIKEEERKSLDRHFIAIRRELRQRLSAEGRVLLLLDNITDLALLSPEQTDTLRTLGPDLHLLATTRLGSPAAGGIHEDTHWLTLGELTLDDSLRLLEKHRLFDEPVERAAAECIARRLGGFALCVEVTGAYLGQYPDENYTGFLRRMGLEDLEQVDLAAERGDVRTRRHNNEKRLSAILAPSLASLPAECITALQYASLLPPDYIVLPWLKQLAGSDHANLLEGSAEDAIQPWNAVVQRLFSLALLTRCEDVEGDVRVARCHRLVQDFLRRRLDLIDNLQQSIDDLVRERGVALENTTEWVEARWELGPFDALASLWADKKHPGAPWLLSQVGVRWHQLAEWTRAEPALRRVLAIDREDFMPGHSDLATDLNNLAEVLKATNRLKEAEPLMREALEIDERDLGPDNPRVATRLSNLALLLRESSRLDDAEPMLRRALQISERCFGPEDPKVAIQLNNLALVIQERGRLEEAEAMLRRALDIDERSLGPNHPNVATRLNNLGQLVHIRAMVSRDTDRLEEAEAMTIRALKIDEASFGPNHPSVATDLNNLALILRTSNRMIDAQAKLERALQIEQQRVPPDLRVVAIRLNNLASVLQERGRLEEAEPMMRRALEIDEGIFGPDHPNVAMDLNYLSPLLVAANRPDEAEIMMRRTLDIENQTDSPDLPSKATHLNNLAMLLLASNRLEEVELLLQQALQIDEDLFGSNHPVVARDLNNLALLFQKTSRWNDAEGILRRALLIDEQHFAPDHPNVVADLKNLTPVLRATHQLEEAENIMRRALMIDEQRFGPDHPEVAADLDVLGLLLREANRLDEAEPLMRRALEITLCCKAMTGHEPPGHRNQMEAYKQILAAMGRTEAQILARLRQIAQSDPDLPNT